MKKSRFYLNRLSLLVLTWLAFASSGLLAQGSPKLVMDPAVRTGKLPNGMTYYIRRNVEPANRMEMRLAVNAGSVLENDDQQGLAHFCEHMAFNGSTHFKKNELVDALEAMGVKFGPHLNAYTSFDETVYMLQVPTDKQDLVDKAMLVLEDWAMGLSFDNNEIDKERGVVMEEWRLRSGAMTRTMMETMPVIVNGSHYADRLPIGKPEILQNFKYETLKDFYKKWYRPDLMAVILVGDFDLDKMTQAVIDRFSKIPAKANAGERPTYPVPDHEDVKVKVVLDKESPATIFQIMYKHDNLPYATEADLRTRFVGQLASGMLSDRVDELKQKGECPVLFAGGGDNSIGMRTKSAFSFFGLLTAEGAKKASDVILTEIERARQHGFIATELERQKTKRLKQLESSYNEREKTGSDRLSSAYVEAFLNNKVTIGPEKSLELGQAMIPGITLEEVNAQIKAWLLPRNVVITLTGVEKEAAKFPTEAELLAKFESLKNSKLEAYKEVVDDRPLLATAPKPGKVVSTSTDAAWGVTEWKLSNGAKVILKPTTFKDDEIKMSAFSLGGTSRLGDSDFTAAWACADLISKSGVGPFKEDVLQKKLSGKTLQLSPYIQDYTENFWGSSSVADFETFLQLLHLYFTAPRQDSEAFASMQQDMKGFAGFSNGPEGMFQDSIQVILAQHNNRVLPLTEERVDKLKLQPCYMSYMDRFMDASDFTFVFVGNFDVEKIKPWVETYIGGIPGNNRKENCKDQGIEAQKGIVKKDLYAGKEPKSMVGIVFPGEFTYTEANVYEMNAMLGVLRIMLRESMREEKGGVYGVSLQADPRMYPRQVYDISIDFGCAPDRVQELITTAMNEITKLQNEGASEKNLQKVQEIHRRERETDLKRNDWWLETLEHSQLHNAPLSTLSEYDKWINGLTTQKIGELAKKYIHLDRYVQVVLYPEK
jgi:zinc protease